MLTASFRTHAVEHPHNPQQKPPTCPSAPRACVASALLAGGEALTRRSPKNPRRELQAVTAALEEERERVAGIQAAAEAAAQDAEAKLAAAAQAGSWQHRLLITDHQMHRWSRMKIHHDPFAAGQPPETGGGSTACGEGNFG